MAAAAPVPDSHPALMVRWLSFTGLVISLLFAACISLIQARTYPPPDLESVLLGNQDCARPCWHHIRPGHTTTDEAVALLEADAWIGQITRQDENVEWIWSGQQPPQINASQPGSLMIDNQIVRAINIPIAVSMGDLYALLGTPFWRSTNRGKGVTEMRLTYPGYYLLLTVITHCPTNRSAFWRTSPDIALLNQPLPGIHFSPDMLLQSITC